jgi:uncharacterized protein with GYD domain
MPKYVCTATYSAGSWARMIRITEHRVKAVNDLLGSLGGSLDYTYWEVSGRHVFAVVDLPDSFAATTVTAVMTHTGAFKKVELHEVLTQDQFNAVLELADNVAEVYRPPGDTLLRNDTS